MTWLHSSTYFENVFNFVWGFMQSNQQYLISWLITKNSRTSGHADHLLKITLSFPINYPWSYHFFSPGFSSAPCHQLQCLEGLSSLENLLSARGGKLLHGNNLYDIDKGLLFCKSWEWQYPVIWWELPGQVHGAFQFFSITFPSLSGCPFVSPLSLESYAKAWVSPWYLPVIF